MKYVRYLDLFFQEAERTHIKYDSSDTDGLIISCGENDSPISFPEIYILADTPPDITVSTSNGWKSLKATSFTGYRIKINQFTKLDDYLNNQFSAKRRANFRRYRQRLEKSFNVSYKTFWGGISPEQYDFLFDSFEKMLKTRFEQLGMAYDEINRIPLYRKKLRELITQKRANCQVIYANGIPISVSFNLISGNGILGLLKSHDPDFAKFSPGFIGLLHLLEWAINNRFDYVDLLKGDLSYKRLFANHVFNYSNLIFYNKRPYGAGVLSHLIKFRMTFYQTLLRSGKKLGLRKHYHSFKRWKKGQRKPGIPKSDWVWKQKQSNKVPGETSIPIPFEELIGHPFRKVFIDYLFASGEVAVDLEIFSSGNDVFLVMGPQASLEFRKTIS